MQYEDLPILKFKHFWTHIAPNNTKTFKTIPFYSCVKPKLFKEHIKLSFEFIILFTILSRFPASRGLPIRNKTLKDLDD